ncbi:DeoR/GlpR family DNA-binding transcription regulator [Caproiciproducens sp. CPB-2]|uniref:DeoR/GlpR family DNA-binding transcription regulator n=1 Tax=Caproiciproducens sp. CPB-2 TaxID=3030017 RepID=UPI0023DB3F77|nr:DeoR/GlpR family DNA-binding transcription regulator [Caproiciproducens sp. CPB-2]MDF1496383.1 DeoR/GlpR family DNA-binding transcription regulator [Caproiciproducens sp. CPB-2]
MEMSAARRRMEIYQLLQKESSVAVNDLAERFHVSAMTIRRDLLFFEKQGFVTTGYGGAYLNTRTAVEPSFSVKSGQLTDRKRAIGYEASRLIEDGDTVIIDCGTTTLQVARCIQEKKLTVITNSWPVIQYLGSRPKIRLILAPGEYNEVSAGAVSGITAEFFQNFRADKVFAGTHGCSLEYGATVPGPEDALVKKALLRAGNRKYLLADHTKFGQTYLTRYADLSEFDCVITDGGIPQAYYSKLEKVCKKIVTAGPDAEKREQKD